MRILALCLLLAACGPSEEERVARRAELVMAEMHLERIRNQIDSLSAEAPTADSVHAILQGPLMDSMAVARERLDRAQRALE